MSIEKDPQQNPAAAHQATKQEEPHDHKVNKDNALDEEPDQVTDHDLAQDENRELNIVGEIEADADSDADADEVQPLATDDEPSSKDDASAEANEPIDPLNQEPADENETDENETDENETEGNDTEGNETDDEAASSTKQDATDGAELDDVLPVPKPKSKRKKKSGKTAEVQKTVTIIHMVFDQPGGAQIKQSFELEPANTGEIIYIEDNYSLGPVADLSEAEGWQARKNWWQSVLNLPEETQPEVMRSDKMKLHQLLNQLEADENTELWIWMGQNERDVAGYYYIISYLMEFQGRIHVLYLNNLPFIDEKGHIFYPKQLSEILPKEFVKAARLSRVVTLSEFELDPEEWDKLSKSAGEVRLLEGGKKLSARENDYYDKIILDQLGSATMKLSRLLGLFATKAKLGVPEYYIIWRIKSLIETGQLISQGEFEKGSKNVSLKATQGQLFVELQPDEIEEGEE